MSCRGGDAAWPRACDAGWASALVLLASRQGEPAWVAGGAAQAGLAPLKCTGEPGRLACSHGGVRIPGKWTVERRDLHACTSIRVRAGQSHAAAGI
jgi:hypothetical protein